MLVSMKELLQPTRQHGFAIGAFNVADSCFVRAVVEEAEATNTPAIISIHPSEHDFVGDAFFSYVRDITLRSPVPLLCIWTTALRLSMCCGRFSVGLPR
jgi:fructose-bisphosphate aldolase class II